MSDNGLWDEHAQWWIDGFTDGADPEYVEQIIPLAVEELAGRHKILDLGCGRGAFLSLLKNKYPKRITKEQRSFSCCCFLAPHRP